MEKKLIRVTFSSTRVVIPANQAYEQVIQAIEERVGRVDTAILEQITADKQPLEAVANAFVGSSTFMYLAKIDQGHILSLSGKHKKGTLYVLGNPLIGNQMHDVTTAVGLYIPFRLYAYEDAEGHAFVAYDVPSSLVSQYENEDLLKLASTFDQNLEKLALEVTL